MIKFEDHTYYQSQIIKLKRRLPLKINFLVKSILDLSYYNFYHKNARVTKNWSHDHIYYIIWATW